MIKPILLFIFSLMLSSVCFANNALVPFQTDYCTGYPEGTSYDPQAWKHCCLIHDMSFWAGGSKQDRYDADVSLKQCVADTGHVYRAKLIFTAVRSGSYSPIKFSNKKWNFGWPNRPSHQKLTQEDIDQIKAELALGYSYISQDIKDNFIKELRSRH